MIITSLLHWLNANDLTGDIIKKENQIKTNDSTPLIKDLKISNIFKDKDDEEGNSVINKLIMKILWLLELVTVIAEHATKL